MHELHPHQIRGVDGVLAAIAAGRTSVCLTSPTGGGKTAMATELAMHYLCRGEGVVLFTNRKLLVDQLSRSLDEYGIDHGIRAADHASTPHHLMQVSSIQTETSRTVKRESQELHPAKLVIVDECHLQGGASAREIMSRYRDRGAAVVGLTATPIDLGGVYEELVVAGTNSELRDCGMLVRADHYGPDEPEIKKIDTIKDVTEKEAVKLVMNKTIMGRVLENYDRLNPDRKPTILFAPGVDESLWFAEQFMANGISAAHLDGQSVWCQGVTVGTSRAARDEVLEMSRNGSIKVLCNRFVLREGIDAPWLAHGILATVFGNLGTYLQSCGRLLRSYPNMDRVTIQDHGGNWYRYGSVNADREWNLDYTMTMIQGMREERLRAKKDREPMRCPSCALIVMSSRCACGHEFDGRRKSRPVVMTDGSLAEHTGDIFKERYTKMLPDTQKLWTACYYQMRNTGKTFREAQGWFCHQHGYYPPHDLKRMPKEELDWFLPINAVPSERLT